MYPLLLLILFIFSPIVLTDDDEAAPLTADQLADAYPPPPVGTYNYYPTRLFGYDGCDAANKAWKGNINEAYEDANSLVNVDGVKNNIKWDDAAALEFFGPDALNKGQQKQMQAVLANAKICSKGDDKDPCKDTDYDSIDAGNDASMVVLAYANNPKQSEDKYSEINFCTPFFDQRGLSNAIGYGSAPSNILVKNDIRRYDNRGATMLHEMLHLDLAANSVNNNPNPQVRDLKIKYSQRLDTGKKRTKIEKAYGGELTKILARYVPFSGGFKKTGYFTQRNDDSYVFFALSKYVQGKINSYPFIPQIINKMIDGPPTLPDNNRPTIIEYTPDNDGLGITSFDVQSCSAQIAVDSLADVEIIGLQNDDAYPASYQTQRQEWLRQITGPQIPNPLCIDEPAADAKSVDQAEGTDAIVKFCSEKQYWDTQIVSPVSMTDGQGKAIAVSDSFSVNGGADKIYLQLGYAETGHCQGNFAFTIGNNDDEKLAYCTDRFDKILNGCDTSSTSKKYGGSLEEICAVYKITTVSKDDPDPHTLVGTGDLGAFQCEATNTTAIGGASSDLANSCTCWYEKLKDETAFFDKPSNGGQCTDIHTSPPTLYGGTNPTKRATSELGSANLNVNKTASTWTA
ncbi:MAG: hypothetical protein Q9170_000590 [Blastenia crenularia]